MIFVICVLLSSVFYRLGGIGKPFNTKHRDFGVPLLTLLCYYFVFEDKALVSITLPVSAFLYLLSFLLMFGACTTYHSWLSRLLGYKDGSERWFNYATHGLGFAVGMLPLVWGDFMGFGIRCIVVATLTALWSHYIDKDWLEEGGRGFIFTASLPLLLIGG